MKQKITKTEINIHHHQDQSPRNKPELEEFFFLAKANQRKLSDKLALNGQIINKQKQLLSTLFLVDLLYIGLHSANQYSIHRIT